MHTLIIALAIVLFGVITPPPPTRTPPPPPPCATACYSYHIYLPVTIKQHDTVCWSNGNYCDWLIRDSEFVFHLDDEGLYNEVSMSKVISINNNAYVFVESDSGEALPSLNPGFTMIWTYQSGYYYWSTWQLIIPQILK
jgi:hypothetical protein